MDKLGEHVPEPEKSRIYRLRTNDEEFRVVYEYQCYNWDENLEQLAVTGKFPGDAIDDNIKDGSWIWTVEWLEEKEEELPDLDYVANDPFDDFGE